jgi:hypothetical protein
VQLAQPATLEQPVTLATRELLVPLVLPAQLVLLEQPEQLATQALLV